MFFEAPGSDYLKNAFLGGQALSQRGMPPPPPGLGRATKPGVNVDLSDRTFDGFTLLTTSQDRHARLVDMSGKVVHRWSLAFSKAIPRPAHVNRPLDDDRIHWFCAHIYPNGDMLGVYQTEGDTPAGYGLAKLDKDSTLIWAYSESVHHSVDVGDDGRIYTLASKLEMKPPRGLEFMESPYVDDYLVVLSPEGKELAKVNVLKAFRDSPFAVMLSQIDESRPRAFPTPPLPIPGMPMPGPSTPDLRTPPKEMEAPGKDKGLPMNPPKRAPGDVLHSNSIRVLNPKLAPRFPMFKPCQVLISMRSIDAIAVVDLDRQDVVWSALGVWKQQHSPEFLDNGNLLIYDNMGSSRGTRVLELDPKTGAMPWSYASDTMPFVAFTRGMAHRLSNGNTLVVDPDGQRVIEVTRNMDVVWELGCHDPMYGAGSVTSARRYAPEQLPFLKGGARAKP